MSTTFDPPDRTGERIRYCPDCKRILGIGCACGLSFAERIKGVALTLPPEFRAATPT